jgi:hypothetical protein
LLKLLVRASGEMRSLSVISRLDEMAADEADFSEVARRIREGTFMVVWKGKPRPTAEENHEYYLGHEVGIEDKGGWVLRAGRQRGENQPSAVRGASTTSD